MKKEEMKQGLLSRIFHLYYDGFRTMTLGKTLWAVILIKLAIIFLVLKLMHRRYDKALFAHKVNLIKEKMPDAFIGVDVMVGCRGETPECFEECYEFLKSLPVTQLHVFPYSERPGTAALKIPYVVDEKEKKKRSKRLLELSDQKTQEFYAQYIGTEAEVLFEKAPRGKAMHGFTKNYIRVELSPALAKEEYDNQLIKVRLGDFNHDKTALKAELL